MKAKSPALRGFFMPARQGLTPGLAEW